MRSKPAYYFLHIPKTGGTSVRCALDQLFHPEQICPHYIWDTLARASCDELQTYQFFRGHFLSLLEDYLNRPLIKFVLLRDPVERTLSHYAHVQRDSQHPLHHQARNQSLDEWLSDPEMIPMIQDFQTNYLIAPQVNIHELAARLNDHPLGTLSVTIENLHNNSLSITEKLAKARAYLRGCAVIGLTDDCQKFITDVCEVLNITQIPNITRENIGMNRLQRPAISEQTLARIRRLTRLDQQLYLEVKNGIITPRQPAHFGMRIIGNLKKLYLTCVGSLRASAHVGS
ncbi:MAG: sulfotransferase family 2 domain-containing protein [Gemmataceae bacterium]